MCKQKSAFWRLAACLAAFLILGCELCIWLVKVAFWLILAACLVWVALTVAERWDAPEYQHSGFCPDAPTWEGGEQFLIES